MKRRTLFSIIVVTLTAGCFTLFYGMHSMWTDTQSAQAVQAATEEVDTLFKDKAHQLAADQLSQEKIEAVATKLHAARQKLTEPEYAAKLASAQADVDAAKHMLTVKKAVAQTTTNLSDLKTLTNESHQALSELADQKPEFVQAYQKRVAQLSDQEAAVAKIASLFDDPDFKEPKAGLSAAQVQTALAALEHVNNQQFADQMLPIIAPPPSKQQLMIRRRVKPVHLNHQHQVNQVPPRVQARVARRQHQRAVRTRHLHQLLITNLNKVKACQATQPPVRLVPQASCHKIVSKSKSRVPARPNCHRADIWLFFVVMITGWITCMPLLLWPMTDSMQNVTKLLV